MSDGMDLGALRQQMQAEEQARAMLANALQVTMNAPARIVQVVTSSCALVDHSDGVRKVLLIAQPTGERIDIFLSPEAVRAIVRAAAGQMPAQQNGGASTEQAESDDEPRWEGSD